MFSHDTEKAELKYHNKTREELLEKLISLQERLEKQKNDLDRCSDIERSLRESEEKYRFLVENSKDIIWQIDLQGRWMFVSSNVKSILGYEPDQVIGKAIWDFIAPEYHDIVKENMERRVLGEERLPYEAAIIARDGHHLPFEILASVIRDKYGIITGIQGISRDIAYRKQAEEQIKRSYEELETRVRERTSELTKINQKLQEEINERNLAEEALRESEEKFRVLADTSAAAIFVYQGKRFISVNHATETITGFSKDELLRMDYLDFIHPDFKEMVIKRSQARQRGEPALPRYEFKIITKSGEIRWMELMAGRIMYMGKPAGVATIVDITERKQAEERMRLTQFAVDNCMDSSIWINAEGRLIYVNDVACQNLGYTREELLSMRIWDIDRDFTYPKFLEKWAALKAKGAVKFESLHRRKDGSTFPVEVSSNYLKYEDREYEVTFDRDITLRKRNEQEIFDAKAQAELYLDLMGHDINNLNQVALGFLELADDTIISGGKLGEENKELIEKPMVSLNSSSKLIDKVMKLRKLKIKEPKLEHVDVCNVLTRVKDKYSHVTGRDISINYMPPSECLVVANELIDEIFINLIENSIKHSPPGRPLVIDIQQARVCEDGKEYNRISIEDNGPGIPDNVKERLFTRFYRGKTLAKGKGLGLYLVKTLVENFGGKVRVEDRIPGDPAKGSKFVVMMPSAS